MPNATDEKFPLPELASATPQGALLSQAIEAAQGTKQIRELARRAAREILSRGFTQKDLLQVATRDEPKTDGFDESKAWDELEELAKLQGNRQGKRLNRTHAFVRELRQAFEESKMTSSTLAKLDAEALAKKPVIVTPITGLIGATLHV